MHALEHCPAACPRDGEGISCQRKASHDRPAKSLGLTRPKTKPCFTHCRDPNARRFSRPSCRASADQFELVAGLHEAGARRNSGAVRRLGQCGEAAASSRRVSPKLLQVYRRMALRLDQLMAFAHRDHARQEQVFKGCITIASRGSSGRLDAATCPPPTGARCSSGPTLYRGGRQRHPDLFSETGGVFEDRACSHARRREAAESRARFKAEGWK